MVAKGSWWRGAMAARPALRHARLHLSALCLPALCLPALTLTACASHPALAPLPQAPARSASIETAPDGSRTTTVSVLIYNVAGLPAPRGKNRGVAMDHIADELAAMKRAGTAPDIVMLQEAFIAKAGKIGARAGYANGVRGPLRTDRAMDLGLAPMVKDFKKDRRIVKGERIGKLTSSGLYIFTDYGIESVTQTPFGRNSCAGFDCLANKGVMLARISIPGVPEPLQLFNTHLNARGAAKVPLERTNQAYERQIVETGLFLKRAYDPALPFLYGGDFNTRHSDFRYGAKVETMPGADVRHYCAIKPNSCEVIPSWDGDAPWMDTQDIQGFASGARVKVTPVRIDALFDEPWKNGEPPSDHDGYLVTYRLQW